MTNEYLLPCPCGQTHRVSSSQSGETITCSCGNRLEVPTLRELKSLAPAAPTTAAAAAPVWGLRQRLLFVGLMLAGVGLAAAGYFWFVTKPPTPRVATSEEALAQVKPAEVWHFWSIVRRGMPEQAPADVAQAIEGIGRARRATFASLSVAAVGLILAALGLMVGSTKPR